MNLLYSMMGSARAGQGAAASASAETIAEVERLRGVVAQLRTDLEDAEVCGGALLGIGRCCAFSASFILGHIVPPWS